MAQYLISETTLTNIANAVREETGRTDKMTPSAMATAIRNMPTETWVLTLEDGSTVNKEMRVK